MREGLRRAPRHVLMTADTVGGVFTYALQLANALRARGVRTTLATMGGSLTPAQHAAAANVRDLSIHEGDFRLEWMNDAWEDVANAGEWLLDLEQRIRPDVVHVNGYAHVPLAWRAPVLAVSHSCVFSWWEAVHGGRPPATFDRYKEVVATALERAPLVVAPTRAMLRALGRHYGVAFRGEVIANGVDGPLGHPEAKEPFVFAAGRVWDEAKNLGALARVAPRLPWPVYVAGEPQHPDGSTVRLDGVHMLGRLGSAEMAHWQRRAAIYASPARYEPFGLSVLEAALAGAALVLGDIPSQREIWGDAATYVDPNDPSALERAIRALIEDPVQRVSAGRRAQARAVPLSAARMADAYLAKYRDLLRPALPSMAEPLAS